MCPVDTKNVRRNAKLAQDRKRGPVVVVVTVVEGDDDRPRRQRRAALERIDDLAEADRMKPA